MPDICDGAVIKTIAFYLPQFHEIEENNRFYGKGFTEWTNVRKAQPLFEGHYQPRVPLNNHYYCLLDGGKTMEWQSELALEYGLFGFCYYHYWFKDGKKLLEKPVEEMLLNHAVKIPFCLSWANENWTKKWDGGNNEIMVEQDYGTESDWIAHFEYLFPFLSDPRYITVKGKPLLLIYKPWEIPDVKKMLGLWNAMALRRGLKGICFSIQNNMWYYAPDYDLDGIGCEYQIKFAPFFARGSSRKTLVLRKHIYRFAKRARMEKILARSLDFYRDVRSVLHTHTGADSLSIWDYDEIWKSNIASPASKHLIECAFTDWDNTPRNKKGLCHVGAAPEKFQHYMTQLRKKVQMSGELPVIFINAWNEWGEGAYLEPDEKYHYQYLEALKNAMQT